MELQSIKDRIPDYAKDLRLNLDAVLNRSSLTPAQANGAALAAAFAAKSAPLVAALRETPNVARHLHVPLQSGDDRILRAMGRRYDSGTFLRRVATLADFNLTTDVIVGFPGEDEEAFGRTLDVVAEAGITKVHAFPYSPRPGTETAAADPVSREVKRERSERLREQSRLASLERWHAKVGRDDVVLVDRPGRGYGDDYSPWLVRGEVGELVPVRGRAVTEEGILAA